MICICIQPATLMDEEGGAGASTGVAGNQDQGPGSGQVQGTGVAGAEVPGDAAHDVSMQRLQHLERRCWAEVDLVAELVLRVKQQKLVLPLGLMQVRGGWGVEG